MAPGKRCQSRYVASGSRANESADNDDRDGPPRRRSRDRVDDLANRRRFAMHQAAWFVDAQSGCKGRRSEKRLGGLWCKPRELGIVAGMWVGGAGVTGDAERR